MITKDDLMILCQENRAMEVFQWIHHASHMQTEDADAKDPLGINDPDTILDYCIVALQHQAKDTAAIFWMQLRFLEADTNAIQIFPQHQWLEYACRKHLWRAVPALVEAGALPKGKLMHERHSRILKCLTAIAQTPQHSGTTLSDVQWGAIVALIQSIPEYEACHWLLEQSAIYPERKAMLDLLFSSHITSYGQFLYACLEGDTTTAEQFLNDQHTESIAQHGAWNEDGDTPMHLAVRNNPPNFIRRLLCYPAMQACLSIRNHEGMTPLLVATMFENAEAVEILLGIPYCPRDTVDRWKRNVLHIALLDSSPIILESLLKDERCLALIDRPNRKGRTPLHCVTMQEPCDMQKLRLLVKAGAKLNQQDKRGYTALHHAVSHEQLEAVQYLLAQHTLNVNLLTNDNDGSKLLPLTVALYDQTNTEIVKILLQDRRHQPWMTIDTSIGDLRRCDPAWMIHFDYISSNVTGHIADNDSHDTITEETKKLELLVQHYPRKIRELLITNDPTLELQQRIIGAFEEPNAEITNAAAQVSSEIIRHLDKAKQKPEPSKIQTLCDTLQWHQSPPLTNVKHLVKTIQRAERIKKKAKTQQQGMP
jgi:hypothetical protein